MAVSDEQLDPVSKSAPAPDSATTTSSAPGLRTRLRLVWRWLRRALDITVFSSVSRRIIFINLAGLAVLVVGILYLNQWRAGLIDARVQSLRVQGEIIAAAIAASATVDSDVISVNPDRLLQLQGDAPVSPLSFFDPTLEFPISPERVAPLLRNLVTPTRTRARIYDRDGFMILDSSSIYLRGEVLHPAGSARDSGFFLTDWWNRLLTWVPGDEFPMYVEYDSDEGKRYPEVGAALDGAPADIVRVDASGQLIVSVAVPVQRLRATVGALLLSTEPGDIDNIIATERLGVLRIALVAAAVTTILSFFLAGTIADPMRRLSAAAERVQTSMSGRTEIPDYSERTDEIGHLSGALRAMTAALFNRIEAIESFAADVAHELKNPLTSLRSAVETLELVKTQKDRDQLTQIIQHDVQRLDRLISDISNASRLDAELARDATEMVDMNDVVSAMISMHQDAARERDVTIDFKRVGRKEPLVLGQDSRLAQVISNLIDNAVSFSPDGGAVEVRLETDAEMVILSVRDQGSGVRGDTDRIFQRFYTDRPDGEHFGDHSGLGLSISRQIIEAHKGAIEAENRADRSGATFLVRLPRAEA